MSFHLAIYTAWSLTSGAVLHRKRLPATYPTAGATAAAGVAYLQQHPQAVGFEIEAQGLEAANDAAMHTQTIYRARLARQKRQRRAAEAKPSTTTQQAPNKTGGAA